MENITLSEKPLINELTLFNLEKVPKIKRKNRVRDTPSNNTFYRAPIEIKVLRLGNFSAASSLKLNSFRFGELHFLDGMEHLQSLSLKVDFSQQSLFEEVKDVQIYGGKNLINLRHLFIRSFRPGDCGLNNEVKLYLHDLNNLQTLDIKECSLNPKDYLKVYGIENLRNLEIISAKNVDFGVTLNLKELSKLQEISIDNNLFTETFFESIDMRGSKLLKRIYIDGEKELSRIYGLHDLDDNCKITINRTNYNLSDAVLKYAPEAIKVFREINSVDSQEVLEFNNSFQEENDSETTQFKNEKGSPLIPKPRRKSATCEICNLL